MTTASDSTGGQADDADVDEINFLELLILLAKHKKVILGIPFLVAVVASAYILTVANSFTGTTKILPPQPNQSVTSNLLGQLGGIAGILGATGRGPSDLYVAMLKSRTVADNLIQRFDLQKLYKKKYLSETRERLAGTTTFTASKEGIITIEVDDEDPKRAAELANVYVEELFKLTKVLAVTEASQRRLFYERQLVEARDKLSQAEAAARRALQEGGVVAVEGQGRAMVEATARLRGEITVKEVQINSMRAFATDRNPELVQVQHELNALKGELARIEGSDSKSAGSREAGGGNGTESVRLLRNLKYYETIYDLLAKQFEVAKIDEARDSSVVQVMDTALPPDRKSKPHRTVFVLLSTIVAGFLTALWVFMKEAFDRARENPEQSRRLQAIRGYLRFK